MTKYSVSGTLTPDATTPDTGEPAGTYGGRSYWQWVKDGTTYRMYWFFNTQWIISTSDLGVFPGTYWWLPNPPPPDAPAGVYSAGGSASGTPTVAEYVDPADDTPDDFSFPAVVDADPETQYVSDPAEVTGMDEGTAISVAGGEYRLNGGEWTSDAGTIDPGDTLELRGTSSASYDSFITVAVTVGTVLQNWQISTRSADRTPTPFAFAGVTDAEPSAQYVSDSAEVTGMDAGTAVSIVGGEYRVNGGAWTSDAGTIDPGDTLELRGTSSASYDSFITVAVTVGTVLQNWQISTRSADRTPTPFAFAGVTDAEPSAQYVSDPAEVTGMDAGTAISVANGEYRINGGEWTSEAGTIDPGDTLELRGTSSAEYETEVIVTVTVGTLAVEWSITTGEEPAPAAVQSRSNVSVGVGIG